MTYCFSKPVQRNNRKAKAESATKTKNRRDFFSQNIRRPPFLDDTRRAISVRKGQARCHTISWETINQNIECLNEYLLHRDINADEYYREMNTLWYAITGTEKVSAKYTQLLQRFVMENGQDLNTINKIASILNSYLSNLRPGNSRTNSSIQGGLDLPNSYIEVVTLRANTPFSTEWVDPQNEEPKIYSLEKAEEVLLIRHPPFIKQLSALLSIHTPVEPYIYTTGKQVQSSDNPNMSHGNELPPGCRIGFYTGYGYYYFFS